MSLHLDRSAKCINIESAGLWFVNVELKGSLQLKTPL